jgi:hypothetical protein
MTPREAETAGKTNFRYQPHAHLAITVFRCTPGMLQTPGTALHSLSRSRFTSPHHHTVIMPTQHPQALIPAIITLGHQHCNQRPTPLFSSVRCSRNGRMYGERLLSGEVILSATSDPLYIYIRTAPYWQIGTTPLPGPHHPTL